MKNFYFFYFIYFFPVLVNGLYTVLLVFFSFFFSSHPQAQNIESKDVYKCSNQKIKKGSEPNLLTSEVLLIWHLTF